MSWRVARSLLKLKAQVDARFPGRSTGSDGTIGDTSHSATKSEHNPDENGVVRAMDITHDPANGVDSYKMAEELRLGRDARILYVISNGRIWSSGVSPFVWRKYGGSNKHDHHIHISVVANQSLYDNEQLWNIPMLGGFPAAAPEPEVTPEEIQEILSHAGLYAGKIDGDLGPLSRKAIKNGLKKAGIV